MKILKKADPAVKTVLGPQRPGPECARVRLSRHVYCSEKTHVLFHELTRQMIALNPEEWEQLEDLKGGIPAAEEFRKVQGLRSRAHHSRGPSGPGFG